MSWAGGVFALLGVAVASFFSALTLGFGPCGGDSDVNPHWVCKVLVPEWTQPNFGSPSTLMVIRSSLHILVPIVLVLIGVVVGAARRDRRYFRGFATAGAIAIMLPWIALNVPS